MTQVNTGPSETCKGSPRGGPRGAIPEIYGAGKRLALLPGLIPAFAEILGRLVAAGADWVQIDEPAFCARSQ
jgi:hypothetical protein